MPRNKTLLDRMFQEVNPHSLSEKARQQISKMEFVLLGNMVICLLKFNMIGFNSGV